MLGRIIIGTGEYIPLEIPPLAQLQGQGPFDKFFMDRTSFVIVPAHPYYAGCFYQANVYQTIMVL